MGCGGKINRRDLDLADREIIVAFLASGGAAIFLLRYRNKCIDRDKNPSGYFILGKLILYIINIDFTYDIFRGILSR